jgi:hypothetical protein
MEWTKPALNTSKGVSNTGGIENEWKMWYEGECRRRTGYCIWVSLNICGLFEISLIYRSVAVGLYVGVPFPNATIVVSRRCPSSHSLSGSSLGGRLSL